MLTILDVIKALALSCVFNRFVWRTHLVHLVSCLEEFAV